MISRWSLFLVISLIFTILIPSFGLSQKKSSEQVKRNSRGMDLILSEGGFGIGSFYRMEFNNVWRGVINLSISGAKDPGQVEYVNRWTGQRFTPGKVNDFSLIPLTIGVQRRLFQENLFDNVRPYLTAGVGPTMVYARPYNPSKIGFFKSLRLGQVHYTVSGYIGFGTYIGSKKKIGGASIRYYFVYFPEGIVSRYNFVTEQFVKKKNFGGLFITASFQI